MGSAVVSRRDLYDNDDAGAQYADAVSYVPMEFEEVDVSEGGEHDTSAQERASPTSQEIMEFQLFARAPASKVDLVDRVEKIVQSRPESYYFYSSTPTDLERAESSAISGATVLAEAQFWVSRAAKNPPAPDVNHDWKPPRRKCRPGKQARANKRKNNQRRDLERKEQEMRRKRPRPHRRQSTGFSFRKP